MSSALIQIFPACLALSLFFFSIFSCLNSVNAHSKQLPVSMDSMVLVADKKAEIGHTSISNIKNFIHRFRKVLCHTRTLLWKMKIIRLYSSALPIQLNRNVTPGLYFKEK